MEQLCKRDDLVLDLVADPLHRPLGDADGESPRRFDTRFFSPPRPQTRTSHHDDNETVASMWVRPADALAQAWPASCR